MKADNRPIDERLSDRGYTVTDRTGKSLGVRMIIDSNGEDVGFLTPLECVSKLLV
jgi:hypothetical protein